MPNSTSRPLSIKIHSRDQAVNSFIWSIFDQFALVRVHAPPALRAARAPLPARWRAEKVWQKRKVDQTLSGTYSTLVLNVVEALDVMS